MVSDKAFVSSQQGDCRADDPAPDGGGGSAEAGDPWPNEDDQPSYRGPLIVFQAAEERDHRTADKAKPEQPGLATKTGDKRRQEQERA